MSTIIFGSSGIDCVPVLMIRIGRFDSVILKGAGGFAPNVILQFTTEPVLALNESSITRNCQVPFPFCPLFMAQMSPSGWYVPLKGAVPLVTGVAAS